MARSDKYKIIIIIIAIIIFIGAIVTGFSFANTYYDFISNLKKSKFINIENTYSEIKNTSNAYGFMIFFIVVFAGFIFCMFFYLLADILDRLEIVSAQTLRTTKVLENFEDKKEKI